MTPEELLHIYAAAFGARNAEVIPPLFAPNGLYELPLIGQRLVGDREIRAGLRTVFSLIETAAIDISGLKATPTVAIAEGRLSVKLHRDRERVEMPLAIVLESSYGMINRLSTHLDARPYRLWSDGPIFAAAS